MAGAVPGRADLICVLLQVREIRLERRIRELRGLVDDGDLRPTRAVWKAVRIRLRADEAQGADGEQQQYSFQ
jgi:hypothetical protein